jgi:hypothetical protein
LVPPTPPADAGRAPLPAAPGRTAQLPPPRGATLLLTAVTAGKAVPAGVPPPGAGRLPESLRPSGRIAAPGNGLIRRQNSSNPAPPR